MKLRVGDIRMDSSEGMTFGESPNAESGDDRAAPKQRLPRAALAAGALMGLAATIGLIVGAVVWSQWFLLIPVYFTGRFVAYTGLLAVGPRAETQTFPARDVRAVLAALDGPTDRSADGLQRALGWTERRTVAALEAGVRRDLIEEDLDIETGIWIYRRPTVLSSQPPLQTLSAADRLEAIEQSTTTAAKHRSNT